MILGVILCCVIIVPIEALVVKPVIIMEQERRMDIKRIPEQNDVYGAETIQLNGRSPRAPSWPEANSNKEKMFLLPRILEVGDQINVTGLISPNPHRVSISLVTGQDGPNSTNPDYNNIAGQLNFNFDSNEGYGTVKVKTITNGTEEEYDTGLTPSELIPDLKSNTISEVTIGLRMVESSNGLQEVDFYMGASYIEKISLKHNYNDIRYIALDGDVEKVRKLDFIFA